MTPDRPADDSRLGAALAMYGVFVVPMALILSILWGYYPWLARRGTAGEPCFPTNTCRPGLRCEVVPGTGDDETPPDTLCVAAGGAGEPCRPDGTCAAPLACVVDRCVPAGRDNAACLPPGACGPGLACFATPAYALCAPPARPVAIAARDERVCVLTAAGGVRCAALRPRCRLRDAPYPWDSGPPCAPPGAVAPPLWPVPVPGLESGVHSLALGSRHACALMDAGTVRCWGANESGQLGDGSEAPSLVPVEVRGLPSPVAQVVLGEAHSCALSVKGQVHCWGLSDRGQAGTAAAERPAGPALVVGLAAGVRALAAGRHFTCALRAAGDVVCFGAMKRGWPSNANDYITFGAVPVPLAELSRHVADITAGDDDLCAILADGALRCVGYRYFEWDLGGYLREYETCGSHAIAFADGAHRLFDAPVQAVAVGPSHGCALRRDGAVVCFGRTFSAGQCQGENSYGLRHYPPLVVAEPREQAVALAVGTDTTVVLTAGGAVRWLDNRACRERERPAARAATYRAGGEAYRDSRATECPPLVALPGLLP